MPLLMQLSGPSGGALARRPRMPALMGVGGDVWNAITNHPLIALAGLTFGGYLAAKHVRPFGAAWGAMQASHSREKAFHGRRRRRR